MVRGTGSVVLEDCSFHEKTNLTEFDRDRTLSIGAQDGEVRREGEGGKEEREKRRRISYHCQILQYIQYMSAEE